MNQKLERIAKLASDYAQSYWDRGTPQWFRFYNDRFAELIVLECTITLQSKGETYSAYLIEKHFGVKE
jgi:hypothetical protein